MGSTILKQETGIDIYDKINSQEIEDKIRRMKRQTKTNNKINSHMKKRNEEIIRETIKNEEEDDFNFVNVDDNKFAYAEDEFHYDGKQENYDNFENYPNEEAEINSPVIENNIIPESHLEDFDVEIEEEDVVTTIKKSTIVENFKVENKPISYSNNPQNNNILKVKAGPPKINIIIQEKNESIPPAIIETKEIKIEERISRGRPTITINKDEKKEDKYYIRQFDASLIM